MRALSGTEKLIIKELNTHSNGCTLINLLGNIAKEMVLEIDNKKKEIIAIVLDLSPVVKKGTNDLEDFFINRLYFINTLLKLLVYLEKEGYIVTYLLSNIHKEKRLIGDSELIKNIDLGINKRTTYKFDNDFIINSLIYYRDPIIVNTEELKIFEKNNFRTQEQIRFKKTIIISIIAITISFIIGVSSLWISLSNINKPFKINQTQLDSVTKRLDNLIVKVGKKGKLNKIKDNAQPPTKK